MGTHAARKDYAGQTYGRMTVDWDGPDLKVGTRVRRQVWLSCADDCPGDGPGEILVRVDNLRPGLVLDCGCGLVTKGARR